MQLEDDTVRKRKPILCKNRLGTRLIWLYFISYFGKKNNEAERHPTGLRLVRRCTSVALVRHLIQDRLGFCLEHSDQQGPRGILIKLDVVRHPQATPACLPHPVVFLSLISMLPSSTVINNHYDIQPPKWSDLIRQLIPTMTSISCMIRMPIL